jgi:hypothetical protein
MHSLILVGCGDITSSGSDAFFSSVLFLRSARSYLGRVLDKSSVAKRSAVGSHDGEIAHCTDHIRQPAIMHTRSYQISREDPLPVFGNEDKVSKIF